MNGPAPHTPVVPGAVLAGRYRVERILGQGAMGVVVAARHVDLGELFAVKLLLPQALAIPQAVDRFLREARAAARIKSEHAVKVTDVGRLEDGSPYMVMEHLSGSDLQQLVRSQGPLPIEEAVTYVVQACDAIAEAHALGIVHRDLKPSNLFLTRRRNGTPCVKVLDFGISKQIVQEAVDLTKTGDVFGTPLYMAPEQMAQSKNADARSDIWSMGIVLYQLLTGTTPFHASTITEVVARVLQEEALHPSVRRPGIPPALDGIVIRCLQKKADLRFQTIDDLAAALRSPGGSPLPVSPGPSSAADIHVSGARQSVPHGLPPTTSIGGSGGAESAPAVPPASVVREGGAVALPGISAAGGPATTASAWGADDRVRSGGSGVLVAAVAMGGTLAALLAAGGLWMALRGPAEVATEPSTEPGSPALDSPSAEAPDPIRPPAAPAPVAEPASLGTTSATASTVTTDSSTSSSSAKPVVKVAGAAGAAKTATVSPGKVVPSPTPPPATKPKKTLEGPW